MRYGFTTGSCSAATAKAAAYMLLSGIEKNNISIETPKGITFNARIIDIEMSENSVTCATIKDGGDDPDVTSGAHICARVSYAEGENTILIDGGKGVGRVTRPGLNQPVGEAAINSVPRRMIEDEVRQVMDLLDYHGGLSVIISVTAGEELAEKTFNPRLGIEGGISILGTSGIVEPMSNQAIIDTIKVELNQRRAMGHERICISPGNYGLDFMKSTYDFDLDTAVKSSNFIGLTIDMVKELGFEELLLVGHIGKLIKVSGGIMNTHSREADCRMELMSAIALRCQAGEELLEHILDSLTTEEAFSYIREAGIEEAFSKLMMERIAFYLKKRAGDKLHVECMVYSNEYGLLGATEGAEELLRRI